MRHQERMQTLCHITLHYFGSHLKLDYERLDPRDEVVVEQQHCGGNTLTVFREKILPKSESTGLLLHIYTFDRPASGPVFPILPYIF